MLLLLLLGLIYSFDEYYLNCEINFCHFHGCQPPDGYYSEHNMLCDCTNTNYNLVGCCTTKVHSNDANQNLTCAYWPATLFCTWIRGGILSGYFRYKATSSCYDTDPTTGFNVEITGSKSGVIQQFNFSTYEGNYMDYFKIKQSLTEEIYFNVSSNNIYN